MSNPNLKHPELDGNTFFLKAGEPAMLLLHGLTATTTEVRPLGEFLQRKGLTISAPLIHGHGTHPDDLNDSRWQDWYQSVETAYLSLKAEHDQVWVGGASVGGLLTLMLAANHPEISGIMLFAPALIVRMAWTAPILKHFVEHVKKSESKTDIAWSGYRVNPVRATDQMLLLQKTTRALLKQVNQPALIVMSRMDGRVPLRVGTTLNNQLKSTDKELVILEDSPHVILLANRQKEAQEAAWNFLSTRIQAKSVS